jgi:hypothetical protein
MKGDFTRDTFRPKKHYRNVNHQQGRVGLDADWNEQAEIAAYRDETEARDVIGPAGAPKHDAGFAIGNGIGFDFPIGPGRFYVDGILCENEAPQRYLGQPDFPSPPPLTAGRHLVYLDVWLRHITALDDPAIREVALGGPDTATRTKTVWQVKTFAGSSGLKCAGDLQAWTDAIAPSTGKLSARAKPDPLSDKPCIVPPGAGYRRLENQLYRVEIHNPGTLSGSGAVPTFKWSRDNGAVVAQVRSANINKITLSSSQQDSSVGFAPGQWIELIDAGQELRGEPGALTQITVVDDLVLTVNPAPAAGTTFAKVRRWDFAGLVPVSIPATNNGYIPLEDGVEVKFEPGSYRTGDYWMIPARTDRGTVEWPQDSSTPPNPVALSPQGIVHHFCRLAIVDVAADGKVKFIEDCRRLFPPLTELEDCCGCCTKTVGATSAADYRSLQEAIDALPDKGGQICILDGVYEEKAVLAHRHDVVIIGCGSQSVLKPRLVDGAETGPILQIRNCRNVRVESLTFRQERRSALDVIESVQVTVCDSNFVMHNPRAFEPAIYFQVKEGLIERSVITGMRGMEAHIPGREEPFEKRAAAFEMHSTAFSHPASAIQLAGGCEEVRVSDNLISWIAGQGITLGSIETTTGPDGKPTRVPGRPRSPDDPCDDCVDPGTAVPPKTRTPEGTEIRYRTPDLLERIQIDRNRIYRTGLDGIGVIGFFNLREIDEIVTVRSLTIRKNQIRDCVQRPPANIKSVMSGQMGYGGIALSDVSELVIHDNVIEHNGITHAQPVCGVFVAHGEGIDLCRNRILDNGRLQVERPNGPCGGVFIALAVAPVSASGVSKNVGMVRASAALPPEATGVPALRLEENIVSSPFGRALTVIALGPVSVADNQFTSGAVLIKENPTLLDAATVFILDLGISNELYFQALSFSAMHRNPSEPTFQRSGLGPRLVNGNVLFNDNQCSLDLLEPASRPAVSSITILSLDDIAFQENQCDCNLWRDDFVFIHALLGAPSLRVTANRFKEGLFSAILSGMTVGLLNETAHNQATHCLLAIAPPAALIAGPNQIVITLGADPIFKEFCGGTLADIIRRFVEVRRKYPMPKT